MLRRPFAKPSTGAAKCGGFTLLEVILALLVLGGSVAVLGEIMDISDRHSTDARAETQAQILAQSVLEEIVAGYVDATPIRDQPIETDDSVRWVYSLSIGTSTIEGISPVEIIVEQDLEDRLSPVKYRLLRWLPSETTDSSSQSSGSGSQGAASSGGASSSMGSGS